jgi:ABC-2 type transport system ATP-binding protein
MDNVSAVETVGLRRTFGDVVAVDALDLRVETGTFFGFLGPNGAGKSTTLKMLTGVLPSTSGSARVLGFDVEGEPVEVKSRIGVVPEQMALFDRLTGPEYLTFVGRMHRLDRSVIGDRITELLELLGLAEDGRKLIVDYSHGMKKKLAFAAAVIHDPRLLFLDEPFEGIDAVASRLIKSILTQLLASGVTIFLTSHILEIVERLCDRIAIIDRGRLVASGTMDELKRGVSADTPAVDGGDTRTLEELFITLVGSEERADQGLSWLE